MRNPPSVDRWIRRGTMPDTRGMKQHRQSDSDIEVHFYDAITEHLGASWDESHPTHNVLVVPNETGCQRFIVQIAVEEVTPEP